METTAGATLPPATVHVLEGTLVAQAGELDAFRALLSPEEIARAERLRQGRHRRRHIVAHARLRTVLGALVGLAPADLRFTYGPHGKPHLPGGPAFSLSHSGDRFVLAIARGGRVGIDVEVQRPVPRMERLVETRFSPGEVRHMQELPTGDREAAFFRIWTLKEAWLKALGTGLATRLASFTVDPRPDRPHALVSVDDEAESPSAWLLRGLVSHPGTSVAVAIDSPGATVLLGAPGGGERRLRR